MNRIDARGAARHSSWVKIPRAAASGLLALSIFGLVVHAAGGANAALPEPAAATDATRTVATLKSLEADTETTAATADARARAQAALARATELRSAGDDYRARLTEGLAVRLAELAADVARAVRSERAAATALRGAQDAGAQLDRERALLEEALAQSGRLRAQLEALTEKRPPDRVGREPTDGGAKASKKAASPARVADGGAP